MSEQMLSTEARRWLLGWVRQAVDHYLRERQLPDLPRVPEHPILDEERGAFVSFHKRGGLRGCIGTFAADGTLLETVTRMGLSAAFGDPRFSPMTMEELDQCDIEISVLSPLEPLEDIEDIRVGVHGLQVSKGVCRGVLLPQVATDQGWDRYEFLSHTCIKAGLSPDEWRRGVDLESFTAEVFSEKELEEDL